MKLYGILTIAAVMLGGFGSSAQQTKILTADKHNEYGLVYTLPITTLEIEVTAKRTVSKADLIISMQRNSSGRTR